jgi:hypothetical protein
LRRRFFSREFAQFALCDAKMSRSKWCSPRFALALRRTSEIRFVAFAERSTISLAIASASLESALQSHSAPRRNGDERAGVVADDDVERRRARPARSAVEHSRKKMRAHLLTVW